jgi:hypothetical protein
MGRRGDRPYTSSCFARKVLLVGARRRLAPASSLPTRTLSTDSGRPSLIEFLGAMEYSRATGGTL